MFITFEGLDGSGKSTQAQLLVDDCRKGGRNVLLLRDPGGTEVSEQIRGILLGKHTAQISATTELLLFSAARAELVQQVILPALSSGTVVVCDRFYDSTTAYQGFGRGLNIDGIRTLNTIATSGTSPDLTLFINVDLNELRRRRAAAGGIPDRMESSGDRFYESVQKGYAAIAQAEPRRCKIIDGMQSIENVYKEIRSIVTRTSSILRNS